MACKDLTHEGYLDTNKLKQQNKTIYLLGNIKWIIGEGK